MASASLCTCDGSTAEEGGGGGRGPKPGFIIIMLTLQTFRKDFHPFIIKIKMHELTSPTKWKTTGGYMIQTNLNLYVISKWKCNLLKTDVIVCLTDIECNYRFW